MDVYGAEPIVANEVSLCTTVRDMGVCVWVNVPFRESEVNHVDQFLVGWQPYDTISKLNIYHRDKREPWDSGNGT